MKVKLYWRESTPECLYALGESEYAGLPILFLLENGKSLVFRYCHLNNDSDPKYYWLQTLYRTDKESLKAEGFEYIGEL